MKYLLLLLALFSFALAAEPTIQINPGYQGGDYSFSGTVLTEIGSTILTQHFSGKATKNHFELSWEAGLGKGSVSVDENGGVVRMAGVAEQRYTDPSMAIAAATGVSGGSAHLMHALWKGDRSAVLPTHEVKIEKNAQTTVVSGQGNSKSRHAVVTFLGDLIVSVKFVYDPTIEAHELSTKELTDAEIKDALKQLNKPETQEEIDAARKMLKQSNDALAKMKDKMVTVISISVIGITTP